MTTGARTPRASRRWLADRNATAIAAFATIGWTTDQWIDTYEALDQTGNKPGSGALGIWLRHPPKRFLTQLAVPVTPAMLLRLLDQHGTQAEKVLAGLAVGASDRFVAVYLGPRWKPRDHAAVVNGWQFAEKLGLSETHATGWAGTGHLNAERHQVTSRTTTTLTDAGRADLIRTWAAACGPDAWLYVLAGIDLDEAIAMGDAGTTPTGEQLRVMAVLNGHTLPAGV